MTVGRAADGVLGLAAPKLSSRSRYSSVAVIKAAELHVSGETESGSSVYGFTCSASTPDAGAWSATHSRIPRGSLSSSRVCAQAIRYCAHHKVQINHGLPG